MKRREFITQSTIAVLAAGTPAFTLQNENRLPMWRGFNLLDFFSADPSNPRLQTSEDHFRWMSDWGFNFVRIPLAYPAYINIDRTKNITAEDTYKIDNKAVDKIDALVRLAMKYKMHVSLNLHRAPGYCINAGFNEPFNLWKDQAAQDAFCFHWSMWSKLYRSESKDKISFDLLNEPSMREDMNDQHSKHSTVPGELYRKIAIAASDAIRKQNKERIIIADGNNVGNSVIPEIVDLNISQSCRGYNPGIISHYKAPWAMKDINNLPEPKWPGQVGDQYLGREMLEKYYKPWIELAPKVGVHCGECGCWNKTPHDVFLAWFGDVLDILTSNKIGYSLWEFEGSFGLINSGRTDVQYEGWYGQDLDWRLLDLLRKYS
ncbi:MAG TPA: cellulase family glycosylhydrolase [Cyclobacteriaceae bacterium]|nr:cellulase family glycosylhydrolase [Cyclobacteriaceae bacterium]